MINLTAALWRKIYNISSTVFCINNFEQLFFEQYFSSSNTFLLLGRLTDVICMLDQPVRVRADDVTWSCSAVLQGHGAQSDDPHGGFAQRCRWEVRRDKPLTWASGEETGSAEIEERTYIQIKKRLTNPLGAAGIVHKESNF